MTPAYESDLVTVYHGDAFEAMKRWRGSLFDPAAVREGLTR